MLDLFWLQVFFAFLVGGGWILAATVMADRFGSKIGGFIGGLPSTIVVSFLFIGLVQGTEAIVQVTTVFPLSYAVTSLFLTMYAFAVTRGFRRALAVSLLLWFFLTGLIYVLKPESFIFSLAIYLMSFTASYIFLEKYLQIRSMTAGRIHPSPQHILIRGFFGGFMVAFTVLISKIGGPILGGIFAAFPAAFLSTLVISYTSQGIAFSRAMTKPLLITGMGTVVVYAIAARYFYPVYGLVLGTVFSFLISMISAYVTFQFMQKRVT
ncbi:DUF3147 family protein [Candidatus Woesearchaeota archaeon]|nr:DUF3147 family protein [Candidatus Woesearchaeota archaeon]